MVGLLASLVAAVYWLPSFQERSQGLYTARYTIYNWTSPDPDTDSRSSVSQVITKYGVTMPAGAAVIQGEVGNQFGMTNTHENHLRLMEILSHGDRPSWIMFAIHPRLDLSVVVNQRRYGIVESRDIAYVGETFAEQKSSSPEETSHFTTVHMGTHVQDPDRMSYMLEDTSTPPYIAFFFYVGNIEVTTHNLSYRGRAWIAMVIGIAMVLGAGFALRKPLSRIFPRTRTLRDPGA